VIENTLEEIHMKVNVEYDADMHRQMQSTYSGGEDYNDILFNSFSAKLYFNKE
jgi:hypothetical protein